MANQIKAPINYPVIAGGKIVAGGSVLFGQPNVKPDEDNPSTLKAVYLDAALTQPAQNPQGLSSDGVFDQSDTGILFGPENTVYSIVIKGANKRELSYIPEYDLSDSNAAATAQDAAAAAASSEANALSFKNLVEALYTDFTNRYFGAFSSDPSVDDLGNPPNEGSIYFNSTSNVFFTWTDGAWVNHFPSNPNGLLVTATGTTTPRTLGDRFADIINVKDFGVVESLVDSNSSAMESAIAHGKAVYVPAGEYTFNASNFRPSNNFRMFGDGVDKTIINFKGGEGVNPGAPTAESLLNAFDIGSFNSFSLEKLTIKGDRTDTEFNEGGAPVFISDFKEASIEKVKIINTKHFGISINRCDRVRIKDCILDTISRDAIRLIDCSDVLVEGNTINHTGDDSIAVHSGDAYLSETGSTSYRDSIIIRNNFLSDCSPIVCLGGRTLSITGNIMKRMKALAVNVISGISAFPEGHNPIFDINVSDNIISDTIGDDGNDTPLYPIVITNNGANGNGAAPSGNADTNNIPPTFYDNTVGDFIYPWDYRDAISTGAQGLVQPAYRVRVQGNLISRTLPNVAKYSDYGYGRQMQGGGEFTDPVIDDSRLTLFQGVRLIGSFVSLDVTKNQIQRCGTPIICNLFGSQRSARGVNISGNILSDFDGSGITITSDGSIKFTTSMSIESNQILGDNYRRNANSNIDGTYLTSGNPTAITFNNVRGVVVRGNHISNCCTTLGGSDVREQLIEGNIIYANYSTRGFSTSNVGVGEIPFDEGSAFRLVNGDFNPTSPDYFTVNSVQKLFSDALPTTGTYKKGAFIASALSEPEGTLGSQDMLLGWKKITNNSTNTLGTDWVEVRVLTAT